MSTSVQRFWRKRVRSLSKVASSIPETLVMSHRWSIRCGNSGGSENWMSGSRPSTRAARTSQSWEAVHARPTGEISRVVGAWVNMLPRPPELAVLTNRAAPVCSSRPQRSAPQLLRVHDPGSEKIRGLAVAPRVRRRTGHKPAAPTASPRRERELHRVPGAFENLVPARICRPFALDEPPRRGFRRLSKNDVHRTDSLELRDRDSTLGIDDPIGIAAAERADERRPQSFLSGFASTRPQLVDGVNNRGS
jgi:hypothetical protein